MTAAHHPAYLARPDVTRPRLPADWSTGPVARIPAAPTPARICGPTLPDRILTVLHRCADRGEPAPVMRDLGDLLEEPPDAISHAIAGLRRRGVKILISAGVGARPRQYVAELPDGRVVRTVGATEAVRP